MVERLWDEPSGCSLLPYSSHEGRSQEAPEAGAMSLFCLAFMKGFQCRHRDAGHCVLPLRCCAWSAVLQSSAASRRCFTSLQVELTPARSLPAVGVTSLSGCHR